MYIDITLKVTPKMIQEANGNEKKTFTGHLGTHFDVMNKEFPLDYIKRDMIIFDVSYIRDEIDINDINLGLVRENIFVAFYTGFMDELGYGTKRYFKEHPQLSYELIDALLDKHISYEL
ncbi:MAG: cyclase family protein [Erysipelotrichaceae bacterium]|nr:cyclase family protein [Erysipelotrichaceae bacterium]